MQYLNTTTFFAGKTKSVKLEDVLALLSAGFLRGGFGFLKSSSAGEMIKGGGGTLNREIRVGVTHVSYFGQDVHFVNPAHIGFKNSKLQLLSF